MIDRREIDEKSGELGVHSSHVQRDYVFGWLLAGIFSHSELARELVLKGGNCLRKAYFPFGRFSNDLDFSASGHVSPDRLQAQLNHVCEFVQQQAGVSFDTSRTLARPKRGADDRIHVVEARVYFRDFYGEESSMVISVRMDVTELDRLYLPVQTRRLIHAYSDYEVCQADLRCVKLEEQLASKMKCLLQRRHVADLFDLVYATIIHPEFAVNRGEVLKTFFQKTIFGRSPGVAKGLLLELPLTVFQGLWEKYIVCPIRGRLDFSAVCSAFQELVGGLFGAFAVRDQPAEFFPAALRNPIMEAGHSLTLLDVTYDGVRRRVEPYSLNYKIRKDGVGREYFYAFDRTGGASGPGIKAFVASGFQRIGKTDEPFEPRFPVEVTKAGEVSGSLYFEGRTRAWSGGSGLPLGHRPDRRRSSGYRYVIRCPVCGKRFRRDAYGIQLRPHKDRYGNRCIGRVGYLV